MYSSLEKIVSGVCLFRQYVVFEKTNSTTCWQAICKAKRMLNLVIDTKASYTKYGTDKKSNSQAFQQTCGVPI